MNFPQVLTQAQIKEAAAVCSAPDDAGCKSVLKSLKTGFKTLLT